MMKIHLYLKKGLKLEHNAASNILSVNSENIMESTPKRRGGLPPGSKNKHSKNKHSNQKPCPKSDANWKFGKSRKRGQKGNAKNASVSNGVDDKENNPIQALIAEYIEKGIVNGATGCASPVKKNHQENFKKSLQIHKNGKKIS